MLEELVVWIFLLVLEMKPEIKQWLTVTTKMQTITWIGFETPQ